MLLCPVRKAAITIAEVLISKFCYSGFGFSLCICNEVATATKRRVKGAKGRRNNEGQSIIVEEEGFLY